MEAKKEKHQSIGNIRAQAQNYRFIDLNNFKIRRNQHLAQ